MPNKTRTKAPGALSCGNNLRHIFLRTNFLPTRRFSNRRVKPSRWNAEPEWLLSRRAKTRGMPGQERLSYSKRTLIRFFRGSAPAFAFPKPNRNFNGLLQLSKLGIPAVEPVAFGTERTRLGFVRSCFLITVFVDGAANLTACSSAVHGGEQTHGPSRASLTEQIAIQLRRAHERRFFLFTPKAKNVLVRETADKTAETIIVDIPYARSLCWSPLARWGQLRDIGVFLASL